MRGSQLAGGVLLALASVGVALGVAEWGARYWLEHRASEADFEAYASVEQLRARLEREGQSVSRFEPHRFIGYVPARNYRRGANRHNELGYRGASFPAAKPEGEFRIVCLGGSTTYSTGVRDWRLSWPHQLQVVLRQRGFEQVRVINSGTPGWSSYETLVNFELRVMDLDPDMVIVYHGMNDLGGRMVWPPSAYRGDGSGSLEPSPGAAVERPLLERSTLARILLVRSGRARSQGDLFQNFMRQAPTGHFIAYVSQRERGIYPSGRFAEVPVTEMLRRNPPIYFRRNLENLVALARLRGIEPVLVTFAHCASCDDPRLGTPEIADGLAEHNRMLLALGADVGVPVFDLAAAFPAKRRLFFDAIHMTKPGNRLRAQLVADYLVAEGLLPPPVGAAASSGPASDGSR